MRFQYHHHRLPPRHRPTPAGGRAHPHGFSLLELVVAMVIFAVLGSAILAGFQQAMRSTMAARDYSTAALLAKRTLTDLRLDTTFTGGTRSGSPEAAFPGCSWNATLTPVSAREGLYDVLLEVHVARAGTERVYSLKTRIFRIPTAGGAS